MTTALFRNILASAMAALTLASCHHKDLCFTHPHSADLHVIFDWRNDNTADPASMSLYLYDTAAGGSLRYEFANSHGGTIRVPAGTYDAFCINSDTEKLRLRGTSTLDGTEVYSDDSDLFDRSIGVRGDNAPRAEGTEDERIAHQPERFWTHRLRNVDLSRIDQNNAVGDTIYMYPEIGWCNYTVEIRNADNLKYVSDLSGSLASMAGGIRGHDARALDERVTVPFSCTSDATAGRIDAAFRVFEHCPVDDVPHTLTIYCFLADGTRYYYTFDVTDQVHDAPDRRNVHIIIDGLPLPKPIVNGGGFKPSVADWEEIEIELPM